MGYVFYCSAWNILLSPWELTFYLEKPEKKRTTQPITLKPSESLDEAYLFIGKCPMVNQFLLRPVLLHIQKRQRTWARKKDSRIIAEAISERNKACSNYWENERLFFIFSTRKYH